MAEKSYKPVGGVVAAVLYPVGALGEIDDVATVTGIEVELLDDGSSYEEEFISKQGLVSVKHTLTLCAERSVAQPWLDSDFVQRCAAEGVVARVELSSGEEVQVGWSPKFQFEQALRLAELRFRSGRTLDEVPCVVLTLVSSDVGSALQ
jgi:hypothetical protein